MSVDVRVKETTTTTGTGDLTLAGAATNHITFNTGFGTNVRFPYAIIDDTNNVWEYGRGYLSGSTTLVREAVLRNSSGTTSALSFSAGTKDVFCDLGHDFGFEPLRGADNAFSGHQAFITGINYTNLSSVTLTVDRLYYVPMYIWAAAFIDGFKINVLTAAGTSSNIVRAGLYSAGTDGLPERLLFQSADFDPSTTGQKAAAISDSSTQYVTPGFYYGATAVDVGGVQLYNGVVRTTFGLAGPLGGRDADFRINTHTYETLSSWSALPSAPGTLGGVGNSSAPIVLLRAT